MPHIQKLPAGPLAIIGDIHGELDALDALLSHLDANHPDHHIVFLGDLADRGPDSPGVIRRVRERMALGAQCVLGNHELSVVRGKDKGYNRWFFTEGGSWLAAVTDDEVVPMATLPPSSREDVSTFFANLPLALERDDLRVVHACWDDAAIQAVRHSAESTLELFDDGPSNDLAEPEANLIHGEELSMRDDAWEAQEAMQQNGNVIAVLTSGKERPADVSKGDKIIWSGEKWRPLVRDRWWDSYDEDIPVVIGHYSHNWRPEDRDEKTAQMFPEEGPPGAPVGPRNNVYCIDYGVGSRFQERHQGVSSDFSGRLAALLWRDDGPPQLLFDDKSYVQASSL